jgi:L-lactate dehydrogenase complex protein LldE
MNVHIFIPCFMDQLFPQTAFNMVKVLEKVGCTVHYNTNQTCCGQPAFNAGYWDEAKAVCSKFIADFAQAEVIVCPSASCVGFVKNYYATLFNENEIATKKNTLLPKLYEFTEFLVDVLHIESVGAALSTTATYHDSCAALRECNIKEAPRKLLAQVKGLQLLEMNETTTCCGFGGSFAVKFDAISIGMADQKITNATDTGAQLLISTDVSCLMHLDGYIQNKNLPIKTMHIADVLASGW